MSKYQMAKERARNKAIEWKYDINYSYKELIEISCYFEKLAKRYGLVKEFKENGII